MEKQKITVRVAEKNYTLVSSDSPEYLRRVAALVERRLKEMEIASGMPAQQVMALTCFNLADELLKAKDENTELKRRMQESLAAAETGMPAAKTAGTAEAVLPSAEAGGAVKRRRSGNEA